MYMYCTFICQHPIKVHMNAQSYCRADNTGRSLYQLPLLNVFDGPLTLQVNLAIVDTNQPTRNKFTNRCEDQGYMVRWINDSPVLEITWFKIAATMAYQNPHAVCLHCCVYCLSQLKCTGLGPNELVKLLQQGYSYLVTLPSTDAVQQGLTFVHGTNYVALLVV